MSVLETEEAFEQAIFDQVQRQQVTEEPVASETPSPTQVSEPPEEKPRDDKGRFVKAENMVSRAVFDELSEKFKLQAEQLERLNQQVSTSRAPVYEYDDDDISEDPALVAQYALENRIAPLYEKAMDAWYSENPKSASRFEMQKAFEEERKTYNETLSGLVQSSRETLIASSFSQLAQQYDDLQEKSPQMIEAINVRPWLRDRLVSATPDETMTILRDVYKLIDSSPATTVTEQETRITPPFTETGAATTPAPLQVRTAVDVLRDQILGAELSPLERGIRRMPEPQS